MTPAFRRSLVISVLAMTQFACSAQRDQALDEGSALSASIKPCGEVIGSIDGINAYSNGKFTNSGNSCAGEGGKYGYLYQCKELVSRYFMVKYKAPMVYCHAGSCLEKFASYPAHFSTFKNGSGAKPQRGDAIVFKGYTYGHIALVTEVKNGAVHFIQQNTNSATGQLAIDAKGYMSGYNGFTVYGIIRH